MTPVVHVDVPDPSMGMHHDEIASDADVVRHLVADQCPQWADLTFRRALDIDDDGWERARGRALSTALIAAVHGDG